MSYVAAFDIGTSTIKAVLVDEHGHLHHRKERAIPIIQLEGYLEQDPESWWTTVQELSHEWWQEGISPSTVHTVSMTGQMQDCIPVNKEGKAIRNAILYSDSRANEEAEVIHKAIPNVMEVTENYCDGSMVFPKLLWLQRNELSVYEQMHACLVNAKDYIILQLTGQFVADVVTGATTGMMNFEQQQWEESWLLDVGLHPRILPELHPAGKAVGIVKKHNGAGFSEMTTVLCGAGDAAASSLGAGVLNRGSSYLYIGSTGWTAFSTDCKNELYEGSFKLPHLDDVHFLSIAPMLNAGNVHRFAVNLLCDGDYAAFENIVNTIEPSLDHPYFLPYIHGERFPVRDANATGSWSNLKATTTKAVLCFSVLEGLSMSIRQLMAESGKEKPTEIIVIGGGTKSYSWCQMLATITGITIRVPDGAEWLPVVGAASLGGHNLNWTNTYDEWSKSVIASLGEKRYEPNRTFDHVYRARYREFVKIYPKIMQK